MNAPAAITTSSERLHVARSRAIDAFGEVEAELVELLLKFDVKPPTMMRQKISAAEKIAPSPKFSKERKRAVSELLKELDALLPYRADLVHSKLQPLKINAEMVAGFKNPAAQRAHGDMLAVYRLEELERLAIKLRSIAMQLTNQINPASSPRPPSQGAATGP